MKIGVLALQGDFREHRQMLETIGAETREVRLPAHLEGLSGLIIPGGESTTIGKLMIAYGLLEAIRDFGKTEAIWGTCAGAILLSKNAGQEQPLLADICLKRLKFFGFAVDGDFAIFILIQNPAAGAHSGACQLDG